MVYVPFSDFDETRSEHLRGKIGRFNEIRIIFFRVSSRTMSTT